MCAAALSGVQVRRSTNRRLTTQKQSNESDWRVRSDTWVCRRVCRGCVVEPLYRGVFFWNTHKTWRRFLFPLLTSSTSSHFHFPSFSFSFSFSHTATARRLAIKRHWECADEYGALLSGVQSKRQTFRMMPADVHFEHLFRCIRLTRCVLHSNAIRGGSRTRKLGAKWELPTY